ncbi:MAG: hypothetical protein H7Z20_00575 [Bdellovibrio sp.]|nr:hypothetical protein [Methylotenera sp.]
MLAMVKHKIQSAFQHHQLEKNLEWMNDLTSKDELYALALVTSKLAKIHLAVDNKLQIDMDLLLEIDTKTYQTSINILRKYMTTLKLNKKVEESLYAAAYSYHRHLCAAYKQFFDVYLTQNKIVFSPEKINLIACRYLNATFAMTKWRYFDDQPAPSGTWSNVYKVIRCAENLAIMNTNLFLYDFHKKEMSIASLLKQGFMMDTLQKGNYSRVQIQLTEQVLKVWASNPVITTKHKDDKYQFFVNIESDIGPERIRAIEKFANYRFWKTQRLVDLIEAYLCNVMTQKSLKEFKLEKIAPTEMMVQLFKKLRVDWCVEGYERQRRSEKRNKRNKLINISHGLENICNRLSTINPQLDSWAMFSHDGAQDAEMTSDTAARVHETQQQKPATHSQLGSENWLVVDESANGFGVNLGKSVSEWIEPGKLVGYIVPDEKDLFMIAEIKSVRKQADGNYRAGMQILGSHSAFVRIDRVQGQAHYFAATSAEVVKGYFVDEGDDLDLLDSFSGVYIESQGSHASQRASLIVPRSEYKRGNKVKISRNGDDQVFEMGLPLMKHRDWVCVALPM